MIEKRVGNVKLRDLKRWDLDKKMCDVEFVKKRLLMKKGIKRKRKRITNELNTVLDIYPKLKKPKFRCNPTPFELAKVKPMKRNNEIVNGGINPLLIPDDIPYWELYDPEIPLIYYSPPPVLASFKPVDLFKRKKVYNIICVFIKYCFYIGISNII